LGIVSFELKAGDFGAQAQYFVVFRAAGAAGVVME